MGRDKPLSRSQDPRGKRAVQCNSFSFFLAICIFAIGKKKREHLWGQILWRQIVVVPFAFFFLVCDVSGFCFLKIFFFPLNNGRFFLIGGPLPLPFVCLFYLFFLLSRSLLVTHYFLIVFWWVFFFFFFYLKFFFLFILDWQWGIM